ncbi:GTP-binding protein, partial [Suillus cothurnatus]
ILIIGRANAGKTTILQRVCNTQENPDIYNSDGEKVVENQIDPTVSQHGVHDIENEMVFRNNPGFVFYNSCGFEAGGQSEFDKVKALSQGLSWKWKSSSSLSVTLEAVSLRICRGALSTHSQSSVAVIVLFTKFDALYDNEFAELISKGVSRKDAEALALQHANKAFANGPQLKLLYNRKGNQHPPRCHICLPDMDKDNADCRPLIELTAETLDNDVLKKMFVSTQQITLEVCMRYAIER